MKWLAKTALLLLLIAIPVLFKIFYFDGNRKLHDQPYRVFSSPEERFRIEVYSYNVEEISFPGQSGDMPGVVYLKDSGNGKILNRQQVEMVQLVENPEWSPRNVKVKLVFDWILPAEALVPSNSGVRENMRLMH